MCPSVLLSRQPVPFGSSPSKGPSPLWCHCSAKPATPGYASHLQVPPVPPLYPRDSQQSPSVLPALGDSSAPRHPPPPVPPQPSSQLKCTPRAPTPAQICVCVSHRGGHPPSPWHNRPLPGWRPRGVSATSIQHLHGATCHPPLHPPRAKGPGDQRNIPAGAGAPAKPQKALLLRFPSSQPLLAPHLEHPSRHLTLGTPRPSHPALSFCRKRFWAPSRD